MYKSDFTMCFTVVSPFICSSHLSCVTLSHYADSLFALMFDHGSILPRQGDSTHHPTSHLPGLPPFPRLCAIFKKVCNERSSARTLLYA